MTAPIHLQPHAPLADRVLLPGDPGRALRVAQSLLEAPKMFNHNRGLWGYTGQAADGRPLTVQSTGMGGPSLAIVASELIELGARRLVRIGTCGGLRDDLDVGQLLIASEAIAADGTSRALGAADRVAPSPALLSALREADPETTVGPVVSTDLFYDARAREPGWRAAGAVAVEMEAATLFRLAERRGVEAGCALIVSDLLSGDQQRIGGEALEAAELRIGELAIRALSSPT